VKRRPHSPHQMTAQLVHALSYSDATKSPLVTMGCPKFITKIAPGQFPPPSNMPTPQPTPVTTPNGNQIQSAVFSTIHPPDRQTDRQTHQPTDGIANKPVPTPPYALLYYSHAVNNNNKSSKYLRRMCHHWLQWDSPNSSPKTVPSPLTIITKI